MKLGKTYFLLSIIALLCCIISVVAPVAAVNFDSAQEMHLQENIYFSSRYIPSGTTVSTLSVEESVELLTTAGLSLDEYYRVNEEMAEWFYEDCVEYAANYIKDENDILGDPTYAYNCHYYAWYSSDIEEELINDQVYWIDYPEPFIKDPHSDPIDEDDICAGDIVVYWSGTEENKEYKHSAVIEDIEYDANGKPVITCISKWGPSGLYRHNIDNVPPDYLNGSTKSVDYYRYTQGEHFLSIDEDNGESGHTFKCTAEKIDIDNEHQTCSYTTECDGEFTVTSVNSSYHRIYCSNCYYSEYVDHDLYMYSAETEDYTVKCRDCNYSVRCVESPEYYGDSDDGHWVSCPDGCYSFYEPHTPDSYEDIDESSHEVVCADCGYTYYEDHNYGECYHTESANYHYYECVDCGYTYAEQHLYRSEIETGNLFSHIIECTICDFDSTEAHTWVSAGLGYRCTVCGMLSDTIPGIMSLPNPELEAYLASLSGEELEEFIASLPEDQMDRVTALLPSDDEHLTE